MPVRYDGSTVTVHEKASNLTFDRRYAYVMRPLRYSINVTLDGCCDHREMFADEDLHRHAVENLDQADALLFGRATPSVVITPECNGFLCDRGELRGPIVFVGFAAQWPFVQQL